MKTRRWIRIDKGLRQNLITKQYEACKSINKKKKYKMFSRVSDAKRWLRGEHKDNEELEEGILFCELYEKYKRMSFSRLTISTIGIKEQKMKFILRYLQGIDIAKIDHLYLDELIAGWVDQVFITKNIKRSSFKKELDEIRALYNWYRENYNPKFANPVMKRHYDLGTIRKSTKKLKAMNQEQIVKFLSCIESEIYRDFALTQYLCASRWSEIAGLQRECVDLHNNELLIKYGAIEDQSKRFAGLSDLTKNGDFRKVSLLSGILKNICIKRLKEESSHSEFLFHINGKYLSYRKVQYQYNKALKKAGLNHLFSSTHMMRYSMATEAMRTFGTVDHVKAATGHKSTKLAEHYSQVASPLQKEVVSTISDNLIKVFKEASASSTSLS